MTRLTERQRQILTLAAEGLTYAEIGERLFIAAATVKVHLNGASSRLGANDRAHAVVLASRLGEIDVLGNATQEAAARVRALCAAAEPVTIQAGRSTVPVGWTLDPAAVERALSPRSVA
ncbi:response regulator transcription factor [Streptomyces sp. LS1784]|uniref:response regulator transcription factor n=1 Tax=Streptomyces sp. LS1784 TaxID=2851533 RepID=UPI001CCCAA14|nr:helix-turn-helix transcriptional regulator [Streptomyces sp. LS1784]